MEAHKLIEQLKLQVNEDIDSKLKEFQRYKFCFDKETLERQQYKDSLKQVWTIGNNHKDWKNIPLCVTEAFGYLVKLAYQQNYQNDIQSRAITELAEVCIFNSHVLKEGFADERIQIRHEMIQVLRSYMRDLTASEKVSAHLATEIVT